MASPKAWWLKAAKGLHGRGRQREAPSARSRQVRLRLIEELEPRVVLTGFINYTAPPVGSDLTLRVANVGGAADLQLFDNASSSVIQQVALNQAIQVQITGADKASDLLTVDFSYAGGGTPEPITVQFAGGLPAMGVTDQVTIGGAGAQYEPSTFTLQSDSPVFVTGHLQATGDISLTAGQQSTGTVTAPGVITANAAAGITVNGSLTGHNITLAALSTIDVNSQSASLFNGLVKAGLVSSSSGASVQVQGGTLTASGNLSLTATSNVTVALIHGAERDRHHEHRRGAFHLRCRQHGHRGGLRRDPHGHERDRNGRRHQYGQRDHHRGRQRGRIRLVRQGRHGRRDRALRRHRRHGQRGHGERLRSERVRDR